MKRYKHNVLKELWWNRPTKYIPAVIQMMKWYPWRKESPHSKFRLWLRNTLYLSWQTCLEERTLVEIADTRTWIQKLFGYCPNCGKWFRRKIIIRRQNTSYCDEVDNWIVVCPKCFDEIQLLWAERWEDYYSSCFWGGR